MAVRVVVVGGGASGLAAAVFAAGRGAKVTILEHKDRVGKKLLMTGNGRCNLTNMSDVHGKYYSSDAQSLEKIYGTLARFDARKTREFFMGLGLFTKEKRDGGVYPVSEQASAVPDVLRSACEALGVRTMTDCEVMEIIPGEKGGQIKASGRDACIGYDRLILATGGKAAPATGSDGSGYLLAKKLGHSIIEPLPALVQLKCAGNFFRSVSGVRAQCRLELFIDGSKSAAEEGELQLTDYGISGIPVFQFSRIASRALYEGRKCEVRINFIPYEMPFHVTDAGDEGFANHIGRCGYKTVEEFLAGFVHKKVASMVCRRKGIQAGMTVRQAGMDKVCGCMRMLTDFRVQATGTNPFENAQVCCGGVPLCEVNDAFESLKAKNVYLIGELLDCDGICGGYNLQWAWATGAIAGSSAADCGNIKDEGPEERSGSVWRD